MLGVDGSIVQESDIKNGIAQGARRVGRYFQKRARPAGKKERGESGGGMWVRKENESKPNFYLSLPRLFLAAHRLVPTYGREADSTSL